MYLTPSSPQTPKPTRLIGRFMDLHVPFEKRMLGLDVSFHGESVVSAGAW